METKKIEEVAGTIVKILLKEFRTDLEGLVNEIEEIIGSEEKYRINNDVYPFLDTEKEYNTMEEAYEDINKFLLRVKEYLGLSQEDINLLPVIFYILTLIFIIYSFPSQFFGTLESHMKSKKLWKIYINYWKNILDNNYDKNEEPESIEFIEIINKIVDRCDLPFSKKVIFILTLLQSAIFCIKNF